MDQPEAIGGKLPAPRSDEPDSLRQDIVDELSDHLQCSLDRELADESDVSKARQNVLDRFGKPSTIARQLWFDSMKGAIMMQRLLLGSILVMTCMCLYIGWHAQKISAYSRRTNDRLMAALAELKSKEPAVVEQVKEWVPSKLRLVTSDGKPVPEGFSVLLSSPEYLNDSFGVKFRTVRLQAGIDGVADLGLLRRRVYKAEITSPWNEQTKCKIDARLATSILKEIICPKAPLSKAQLVIEVDWPEDFKKQDLSLGCSFSQDSPHRPELDGNAWSNENAVHFQLVVTSEGKFISKQDDTHAIFQLYNAPSINSKDPVRWDGNRKRDTSIALETQTKAWIGKYRMTSMFVLPKTSNAKKVEDLPEYSLARVVFDRPANARERSWHKSVIRMDMPAVYPDFEIREGKENLWRITLPPKFVEFIRRQISYNGTSGS